MTGTGASAGSGDVADESSLRKARTGFLGRRPFASGSAVRAVPLSAAITPSGHQSVADWNSAQLGDLPAITPSRHQASKAAPPAERQMSALAAALLRFEMQLGAYRSLVGELEGLADRAGGPALDGIAAGKTEPEPDCLLAAVRLIGADHDDLLQRLSRAVERLGEVI